MNAFRNDAPTSEEFDAMNDEAFAAWWDAAQAKVAETEAGTRGMEFFREERAAAEAHRFGA